MSRKFGVAMLAVTVLVVAGNSAQAALILYDDFDDAGVSATKWTTNEVNDGTVTFDGTTATLDMPEGDGRTENVSSMDATGLAMQLNVDNDFFRMTWDLTPTRPINSQFSFLGARFGRPTDAQKFMAVLRHRGNNRFRAFGPPQVTVDGANNLVQTGDQVHYDVTATMTDAANNLADLTLKLYTRVPALDSNPDGYSAETPLETLTLVNAIVNAGQANDIGFFVGSGVDDVPSAGGFRGTGVFDNVYYEVGNIPEPSSLVLLGLGLVGVVVSRHRPRLS